MIHKDSECCSSNREQSGRVVLGDQQMAVYSEWRLLLVTEGDV